MQKNKVQNLQQLITTRMKDKGISRSDLIASIGYTNTIKGLRRLNEYISNLEAPSNDFVVKLLSALNINALEYCSALSASMSITATKSEQVFKPHIHVLLCLQIRPAIVWQIVHNRCHLNVPEDIRNMPYREEIDAVIALYRDHKENILNGSLKNNVIGFNYHRQHDHYLKFNADLVLEKTVFVPPVGTKKLPLGNRIANMISGGTI